MRGKRFACLSIAAIAAVLLLPPRPSGASGTGDISAFLYLPGVPGDSMDPGHRRWIEVLSCDWGDVPPPRGSMVPGDGRGPAGKLCFGDFSILKPVDAASPLLADYCSRGIDLSHAQIEMPRDSKLGPYSRLVLIRVKILSVRPAGTLEDGTPMEIVTLGFRQVEYR